MKKLYHSLIEYTGAQPHILESVTNTLRWVAISPQSTSVSYSYFVDTYNKQGMVFTLPFCGRPISKACNQQNMRTMMMALQTVWGFSCQTWQRHYVADQTLPLCTQIWVYIHTCTYRYAQISIPGGITHHSQSKAKTSRASARKQMEHPFKCPGNIQTILQM